MFTFFKSDIFKISCRKSNFQKVKSLKKEAHFDQKTVRKYKNMPNLIQDFNFLKNKSLVDEIEFTSSESTQLEPKFNAKLNLNGYIFKSFGF